VGDFDIVWRSRAIFWNASWVTLQLFVLSLILATVVGLGLALMRMSSFRSLRWLSATFVWVFRGMPALVILFLSFFWLGNSLGWSPFQSAIIGLGASSAAYKAEIIRAGLLAVDRGQYEASEALGFTKTHYMRRIIIPQGIRVMIPNYISNSTLLLKSTSLAAVIGLTELTGRSRQLANSTFQPIEILTAAGVIYLVATSFLTLSQGYLERHFEVKR
jgi:His/Glu/Gln/Arg/opine family amino acid ABC transporter permease subunit